MNIEFKKLTPNLAEEFACFFDTTPHNGEKDEDKCYCVTWCGDNVYHNGGKHWFPTPDERRAHAVCRIKNGDIQGYLAYIDGEAVGWCNANIKTNCQEGINYLRTEGGVPLEECRYEDKIKFIFCFLVAPKVQRTGIASKLLEYICKDAAEDGFDFVEAYTKEEFADLTDAYTGYTAMYENCGFSRHAEKDGKIVMRKGLK